MNIIQVMLLSLVEGTTEFLPVSSTFHLIVTAGLLGLRQTDFVKLFEVVIQAGSILAVCALFYRRVLDNPVIIRKIIIGFIPTALIGFVLYKVIKTVFFDSSFLMLGAFIIVGYIFVLFEQRVSNGKHTLSKSIVSLSDREAFMVGIAQALAVVPGVSRAGAVMLALMGMKYKREEAALFSFYLAVPTILAASAYDLYKMREIVSSANAEFLAIGFVGAFISAYAGVRWFIRYLQSHSLASFGWYRIVLGIILLFVS